MGLGIAVAGSISAVAIFVTLAVIPSVIESTFEVNESKKEIDNLEDQIKQTRLTFDDLYALSGSDFLNFIVENTGDEKLWNFEDFEFLVTYDANDGGVKSRKTEQLSYHDGIGFAGTTKSNNLFPAFKIQRGTTVMGATSINATLTEGVDFDACAGDCFIKHVSTRYSGMGVTSGGGNQNMDDFTTFVGYDGGLSVASGEVNFTRNSIDLNSNNRINWEIWEYIGGAGEDNEMKVLDTGICTFGTGTNDLTCGSAIELDAVSFDNDNCLVCTGLTHTVGSGSDRFLIIGVAPGESATVSSVTYGTNLVPLTEIGNEGQGVVFSSLWYLRESDIASATGNLVTITLSGLSRVTMGAVSFTGVDQSWDPTTSYSDMSGSSVSPSVDITTTFDSATIVDIVSTLDGPMVQSAGQTLLWNDDNGAVEGAMSTRIASESGSYTMGWTNSGGIRDWAISSVALQPSAGTPIAGVTDDNDVTVIITGLANPDDGRNDVESCLVTSEWNSDYDNPIFRRGGEGNDGTADACDVSYAVVEWTGSNWSVQRIEHDFIAAEFNSVQSESITNISHLNSAFFHTQQRNGPDNAVRSVCHTGTEVQLTNPTTLTYRIPYENDDGGWNTDVDMTAVTWIISNGEDSEDEKMIVNHYNPTARPSGGSEEDSWFYEITGLTYAEEETAITGFSVQTDRCDEAYPRSFLNAKLENSTHVEFWQSDAGKPNEYTFQVTEFPRLDEELILTCNDSTNLVAGEWMVGDINNDAADPNVFNPGERLEICSQLAYPVWPGGLVIITGVSDNGMTAQKYKVIP